MALSLMFLGTSAFAADGEIKGDLKELQQDHGELHQDNQEIRGDRKEIKGDRHALRKDHGGWEAGTPRRQTRAATRYQR